MLAPLHPEPGILHRIAGGDRRKQLLNGRIGACRVMDVVRCDERDPQLARKIDKRGIDFTLSFDPVAL